MAVLKPDIQNLANSNAISETNTFTLNSSTAIKIADERIKPDDGRSDRIALIISNGGNQDVKIKLQAASIDDLKEGILLAANSVMTMDGSMYKGEVSAIAMNGTPVVDVVEF